MNSHTSMADTSIGTWKYMSPEVLSQEMYDGKADVWSLGVVMYELIMHQAPFVGKTVELPQIILNKNPSLIPNSIFPHREICEIIYKMLSKDPLKRPSVSDIMKDPAILNYASRLNLLGYFPVNPKELKLILIGDSGVGKTSVIERMLKRPCEWSFRAGK